MGRRMNYRWEAFRVKKKVDTVCRNRALRDRTAGEKSTVC